MKLVYKEDYSFKIIVLSLSPDNSPKRCRLGLEVGDVFEFEYGCPGGFCPESLVVVLPLISMVRDGNENLIYPHNEFCCPDGVVTFRLEAIRSKT